ncbi:hypothetical protein BaRGS_00028836 [Batillaria attramentaria]|uniref:Metallo-beta-lactamase domain-containing protein n=1 Tax=Batillaria attramentaria TaxID=370345 RepID=A0ABD0JYF5_9CAEN
MGTGENSRDGTVKKAVKELKIIAGVVPELSDLGTVTALSTARYIHHMRGLKELTFLSAALGSAFVVTYNQYLKPLTEDDQKGAAMDKPSQDRKQVDNEDGKLGEAAALVHEFTKPIFQNGRFENPWETWKKPSFKRFLKFAFVEKNESNVPSKEVLDQTLPIIKPDIQQFETSPVCGVRMMWIGHATVVAQLDGITVMTDPVFSSRAAPMQWLGPKRYRDPPCTIEELPRIDVVVISHNHYDHLDHGSVVALNKRFGKDLQWFVPMGLKKWMNDTGCENVVEMTWWDEHEVKGSSGVRVACTPCQHWCKRSATDDNKVLWSSWCVLGPRHSFHFSGDTGYCRGFKEIGRKYGPFTAAAIPIGAYNPRWFMMPQHVNPKEAVDIHQDIGSKNSIGIHWGTFVLTYEPYLEPKELLGAEIESRKLSPCEFVTVAHGAIEVFGDDKYNSVD